MRTRDKVVMLVSSHSALKMLTSKIEGLLNQSHLNRRDTLGICRGERKTPNKTKNQIKAKQKKPIQNQNQTKPKQKKPNQPTKKSEAGKLLSPRVCFGFFFFSFSGYLHFHKQRE